MKENKKKLTLGSNLGELAIDDERVVVVYSSRESLRREEREEALPGDGRGDEVDPSANEVAVELQRWWVEPKS